ncbi:ABC transporter ATP-binding protein [Candidatus Microgenomates bacterium]|nr:ABC transporter ATP-binding protein [Candidatus Microgenomates bacterium]
MRGVNKVLIELVNVSKLYKVGEHTVHALDNVSLTIKEGEFVSITGASGSGKSTLMHIIGLLDTPTVGSVIFEGEDISQLSESELATVRNKKLGFVFQQFNLLERTTALENVALPLLYSETLEVERNEQALEALRSVGLLEHAQHHANQLSGGQQQRVAIARALVNNPKFLLADEPTGNLDSRTTAEIVSIFKQLNRQGKTVIIVTHEASIARQARRIIYLKDGKITKHAT